MHVFVQDGLTAVHYAVWRDRPDIVRCLLERLPAQESLAPILLTGPTQGPSLVHLAAQLSSQVKFFVMLNMLCDCIGLSLLHFNSLFRRGRGRRKKQGDDRD